jgi:alcohol dehydrogenase
MKAAVIEFQGGLDALSYREWPDPVPEPDEAIVSVRAVGLNHLDIFVRRGMPGFPVPMPFISGGDIAGVIDEVGDHVTGWIPGDRVVANPATRKGMLGEEKLGGLAERVAVPAENLIRIPDALDFVTAAAMPIAYGTANRMLITVGQVQHGELVLVFGASGGVGTACVEIARHLGATVIAAAGSAAKCRRLAELGAHHTIDYASEDFSRRAWEISGKRGVDVAVNFTGGDTWIPTLRAVRPQGRVLTCGATAGHNPMTDLRYIWVRELKILGSNSYSQQNIENALALAADGRLAPAVSHRFPLSEIREAHRLMEDRSVFGKIVLEP